MSESNDEIVRDMIDASELFEHLSDKLRATLAKHATLQTYSPGTTVIEEGDAEQNHLYIVVEGTAKVWTRAPKGRVDLQELERHDYFGEVSLLSDKVATATVEASGGPLRVVAIDRKAVLEVVDRDETVRNKLEGVTLERAKDTIGKVME